MYYLHTTEQLIGRSESFGDAVFYTDPITLETSPVTLNFEGITQALGAFLLTNHNLLPNPNEADTESVNRGKAIFERPDVGCQTCHPAPTFAVSTDNNPFNLPERMGPVISPNRREDGINLDLYAQGFMDTFPNAEMDACSDVCGSDVCEEDGTSCDDILDVYMGATTLRGIWDRVGSGMLHDGRARNLREVICTPGHPALLPGEVGFNERDGIFDTHGGTSHLSQTDIEDLISYLLTL